MRRLFAVAALCTMFAFTGCQTNNDTIQGVQDDLGWIVDDETENVFPEEMLQGGKEIFGDGRSNNQDDLFTRIENKIWSDE